MEYTKKTDFKQPLDSDVGLVEYLPSIQERRGRANQMPISNKLPVPLLLIIILLFFFSQISPGCSNRHRNLSTQADGDILDLSRVFCHYTVKITDIFNFMKTTVVRVETDTTETLISGGNNS